MAVALFLKPVKHVAVNAKMNGGFALRHDNPCAFPKIVIDSRGLWRAGTGFACSARNFSLDRAK